MTATGQTKPFQVRLPRELHSVLLDEAKRQGVSANLLATSLLAASLHWRQSTTDQEDPK